MYYFSITENDTLLFYFRYNHYQYGLVSGRIIEETIKWSCKPSPMSCAFTCAEIVDISVYKVCRALIING